MRTNLLRAAVTPILAAAVCLVAMSGCKDKTRQAQPKKAQQKGATTMSAKKATADIGKYGFRHDPMKFVEDDRTLQGALVRARVFKEPKPGDKKLIEAEIQKVLSEQRPEGGFTNDKDGDVVGATGGKLLRLYQLGCDPQRPEVKRAIAALRRAAGELAGDDAKKIGCYALRAMCQAGITQPPAVKASLLQTAGDIDNMLGQGCPWTPEVQLNALWAGREVADVAGPLVKGVKWVSANLEPPGCSAGLGLCMPWSIVQMVCVIDEPACRDIAAKLVPMLLRLQKPDGGWGDDEGFASVWAFTALTKHGLLELLRELPPLPPDWRVVRSIPSPVKHKFSVMASDGERLWVHEPGSDKALAVSPEDGKVVKTVKLPEKAGVFGVWGGSLWYLSGKTLCRVDPDTGKIARRIPLGFDFKPFVAMTGVGKTVVIPDQFEGGAWAFDPAAPAKAEMVRLAAGMPDYVTSFGSDIWALDSWAGAVVRTNLKGELLDWGEQPFGWAGIAFDGQQLWAFDHKNKRICIIEKTESGKQITASLRSK